MKRFSVSPLAACLAVGLGWATGSAQAQVSTCSATANSVSGIYTSGGAQLNLDGSISVTCTRVSGVVATQTIYLGISDGEPPAGRLLIRQNAAQTLAYNILRPNAFTVTWNTAAGRTATQGTNGGLNASFAYGAGGIAPQTITQNFTYRLRLNAGLTGPAGIYDDTAISLTVRQATSTGNLLTTATFGATVSILSQCFFSTAPAALSMNYTSFAAAASTGTSNFAVTCTQSTPYTLALDATSGTLLGLNYTLGLSAAGATGTAFAQNFTVNGSIAAGQAGTCATANCSATQARTLTITY